MTNAFEIILLATMAIGIPLEYRRAYKTNNESVLYNISILSIVILSKYFLSFNYMLALLGLFGASILFHKSVIQKKDKSLSTLAFVVLLMSLTFLAQQILGFKL
jgi:hypothetical protein